MKVSNVDRLKRKIAAMPAAARDEIRKAMQQSAEEMVATAKAFAPVDSGDLRDSIGYTFGEYRPANSNVRGVAATGGGHDLSVTIHAGDEKAFYAAFVEFGTAPHEVGGLYAGAQHPGASAHPYFFPAYRLTKKRAKGRITRAVTRAAKKVAQGGK